jgi:uncharacterized protein
MSSESDADPLSVLLRFEAQNARSFREPVEVSLVASRLAERGAAWSVPVSGRGATIDVLPSAVVFGPNASGKTNLLRAMADMRAAVVSSFRFGDIDTKIPRWPFRLDSVSAARPTRFSVDLAIGGVRHEYGFVYDDERFVEEWAYWYPRGKQSVLFERDGMSMSHGTQARADARMVERLLRPNALFLSTAGAAAHAPLMSLHRWFASNLVLAEAANRVLRHARTISLLQDSRKRKRVLDLLRVADLGITDARIQELDPDFLDRVQRAVRIMQGKEAETEATETDVAIDIAGAIRLSHRGADGPVEIDHSDESLGTLVWLGLLGPLVDALDAGTVLLADELDSSLHPHLVEEVGRLFQDKESNPRGAQLIANAFDTVLLGDAVHARLIGRDQVWFSEKGDDGATSLVALADYSPRKQEDLSGRYLSGRYGGVPLVTHREFVDALAPADA